MYPPQTQSCFHTTIFLLPSTFSATHGQSAAIERCHIVKLKLWKFRLELNPVVTLGSSAIIWGLVIWCMVKPDEAKKQFSPWAAWITETWTWFYIGRNQNHYLTNSMGIFFFSSKNIDQCFSGFRDQILREKFLPWKTVQSDKFDKSAQTSTVLHCFLLARPG